MFLPMLFSCTLLRVFNKDIILYRRNLSVVHLPKDNDGKRSEHEVDQCTIVLPHGPTAC